LDRGPSRETRLVEELLYRVAAEKPPTFPRGSGPEARKKFRADWEAWWKDHAAGVEDGQLGHAAATLGHTVVLLLDSGQAQGLDAANRVRWQFSGLRKPLDIQPLPGDRVLVAEHDANRVSERDRKGEVLWERKVEGPVMAQRLPNGNTFVA